jgi:hypothetical protein
MPSNQDYCLIDFLAGLLDLISAWDNLFRIGVSLFHLIALAGAERSITIGGLPLVALAVATRGGNLAAKPRDLALAALLHLKLRRLIILGGFAVLLLQLLEIAIIICGLIVHHILPEPKGAIVRNIVSIGSSRIIIVINRLVPGLLLTLIIIFIV